MLLDILVFIAIITYETVTPEGAASASAVTTEITSTSATTSTASNNWIVDNIVYVLVGIVSVIILLGGFGLFCYVLHAKRQRETNSAVSKESQKQSKETKYATNAATKKSSAESADAQVEIESDDQWPKDEHRVDYCSVEFGKPSKSKAGARRNASHENTVYSTAVRINGTATEENEPEYTKPKKKKQKQVVDEDEAGDEPVYTKPKKKKKQKQVVDEDEAGDEPVYTKPKKKQKETEENVDMEVMYSKSMKTSKKTKPFYVNEKERRKLASQL